MNSNGGSSSPADSSSDSTCNSKCQYSKKPKYSRFSQQEVEAFNPILTPGWVITAFISVGIVFMPIGLACLFASENVVEIKLPYDSDCVPSNHKDNKIGFIQSTKTNKTCILTLPCPPKQMKAPIFIYYQLDKFYQNHRRYVKSRNDKQLRSKENEDDVDGCSPEDNTIDGDEKLIIVPCGLIAWTLFNDSYVFSVKDKFLDVNKKDIAWQSDQHTKFGDDVYPKNFQTGKLIGGAKLDGTLPLSEQVDLIVWMRTAVLPKFRKLYGKIDQDIDENEEVEVVIQNNYNTYSFQGTKTLVLSTANWMGGKNNFLGIAYLTVGAVSLFLAILVYVINPRPLGDPSYLSWNTNPSGFSS